MRKIFYMLIILLVVLGSIGQLVFSQEVIKSDLIMVGGSTTGTYYGMAAAIGNLLVDKLDYIKSAAAQVTGASTENARLIEASKADFGLASAATIVAAMRGENPFDEGILKNLRTICWAHSSLYHLIVAADSDIHSVSDFKGKIVRMDTLGSGGYYTLMRVLDEYGLTKDDIRARTVTTPWDAYKEGSIDVLPLSQRIPSPSVIDIHARRPVRLLSFEPEKLDSFLKNNAGYRKGIIPAGSYEMIEEDIQTIDASAVFITNKDMPEELVYQVVKLMDENIDYLKLSDIHFQDYGFTPDVADSTLCPLHPGAERYYREIGLLN